MQENRFQAAYLWVILNPLRRLLFRLPGASGVLCIKHFLLLLLDTRGVGTRVCAFLTAKAGVTMVAMMVSDLLALVLSQA